MLLSSLDSTDYIFKLKILNIFLRNFPEVPEVKKWSVF